MSLSETATNPPPTGEALLLWSAIEAAPQTRLQLECYLDTDRPHPVQPWLELVKEVLPSWHQAMTQLIQDEALNQVLRLPMGVAWSWDVTLADNEAVTMLNRDHRRKDQPTDVLSFPAWDETTTPPSGLPEITLGSIVISVEFALTSGLMALDSAPTALVAYLLERMTHGTLHLLGYHHETMVDYERVIGWQQLVMAQVGSATGLALWVKPIGEDHP